MLRGVGLGWLDEQDIGELAGCPRGRGDYTVEELIFAFSGDRLRVPFLGEEVTCKPEALVAGLSRPVQAP